MLCIRIILEQLFIYLRQSVASQKKLLLCRESNWMWHIVAREKSH